MDRSLTHAAVRVAAAKTALFTRGKYTVINVPWPNGSEIPSFLTHLVFQSEEFSFSLLYII